MQQGEIRGQSIFLISITIESLTTEKLLKVPKEDRNSGNSKPERETSQKPELFIGSGEVEFPVNWGEDV